MIKTSIITVLILISASVIFSQELSKTQKEVLAFEEAGRSKFLKGDTNWDELIADGAYMIGYNGAITIYKQGAKLPALPLKTFDLSEMIIRVYGKVAVVTALASAAGETPDKKPFSFKVRYTNVWERKGKSWKITVTESASVRPSS